MKRPEQACCTIVAGASRFYCACQLLCNRPLLGQPWQVSEVGKRFIWRGCHPQIPQCYKKCCTAKPAVQVLKALGHSLCGCFQTCAKAISTFYSLAPSLHILLGGKFCRELLDLIANRNCTI